MSDSVAEPQESTENADVGGDSQSQPEPEQQSDQPLAESSEQPEQPELPKWMHQLPGDLQGDDRLREFSTLGELAKAVVSERETADRKVLVPGDDSEESEREQFFNAIGRPESPEGYELESPEGAEELGFTEDQIEKFKSKAHEVGLTKQQAEQLHSWQAERTKEAVQQMRQTQEQDKKQRLETLKKEYGDQFNTKVEQAKRAFRDFGGDNLLSYLKKNGQADDPELIRAFAAIHEKTANDNIENGTVDPFGNKKNGAEWYPNTKF